MGGGRRPVSLDPEEQLRRIARTREQRANAREIAKVQARLSRFRQIAKESTAEGEVENARRLAGQAEAKLAQLAGSDAERIPKRGGEAAAVVSASGGVVASPSLAPAPAPALAPAPPRAPAPAPAPAPLGSLGPLATPPPQRLPAPRRILIVKSGGGPATSPPVEVAGVAVGAWSHRVMSLIIPWERGGGGAPAPAPASAASVML